MARRSKFATDFSVGFVVFLATVLAIVGLLFVETGWRILSQKAEYRVRLPSASGLRNGTKVYLSGIEVGSVREIYLPDDLGIAEVEVRLGIQGRYRDRIRKGSYAWLQTEGLLGDAAIHVRPGPAEAEPLEAGEIIAYKARPLVDELVGTEISSSTADLLRQTIDLMQKINAGEGTIGRLVKDPALYENLNALTKSMDAATRELVRIADEFDGVLKEVRDQRGLLGKLLLSEEYARLFTESLSDARDVLGNLREVSAGLKEGRGATGSALARLERAAASLESILAKIERGEGSLGILVNDPSLAASLRDVFLGVQETGIVQSLVRSAERAGREAYVRGMDVSERDRREVRRARVIAALGGRVPGMERGPEAPSGAGGKPVPAAGPQDDGPVSGRGGGPAGERKAGE
ncbi:MAG: MlaD family protein [Planctomycetota bacterium]